MSSYCCGWGNVILVSALTDHSAEFPSLLNNGKPLLELVFPVFANFAFCGWRWITFLTTVITGLAFSWSELGGVALWDGVGAVVFWGGTVVSSYFASWLRSKINSSVSHSDILLHLGRVCEFFRGKISVILTDTESTCFWAISIQLIFILFTKSFWFPRVTIWAFSICITAIWPGGD